MKKSIRSPDFDPFHPPGAEGGSLVGVITTLAVVAAICATMGTAYLIGRGAFILPEPVLARLPKSALDWIPEELRPLPLPARTPLQDYAFVLVRNDYKQVNGATLDVRLTHKPTGKSVPDAVVFARRIDMAPDSMPTMTSTLVPEPSPEPGVYRFRTDLAMEGAWQLSLAAKVQGEAGTVDGRLTLQVRWAP